MTRILLNDIQAYLNVDTLSCLRKWSRSTACVGTQVDLNKPKQWYERYSQQFGGFDAWMTSTRPSVVKVVLNRVLKVCADTSLPVRNQWNKQLEDENRSYLSQYLISRVENSEADFHFYIPPYSRLYYVLSWQKSDKMFGRFASTLRTLSATSETQSNLFLYGFDELLETWGIENYKDMTHYHPDFDQHILKSMEFAEKRLNSENVEEYIERFCQSLVDYDLASDCKAAARTLQLHTASSN